MTVELLALLLVSGVAFVSAGVTDNQAEQWSEVDGSESVCKTDLEKLSQVSFNKNIPSHDKIINCNWQLPIKS